ncbi:MAG: TIGR00269 family protein [Candidatus Woesearchaeota archaeon]
MSIKKCSFCSEKSIYVENIYYNVFKSKLEKRITHYCKKHFIEYFEDKVKKTIKRFNLLKKNEKVCIAASGGKDSSSLLFLLKKLNYNVEALAVDEGIKGYRDKTLRDLKNLCKNHNINLKIVSFKENFGLSLDNIVEKEKRPCSACGILRRRLLNYYSKDYDLIATGHNLDDESQAILMNLFKGNIDLLKRLGPVSGERKIKNFTKRVKPFYFCSEKEILIYSFLNKLEISYNECPYVFNSFRAKVRDFLNKRESEKNGIKYSIVNWFLKLKFKESYENLRYCKICNEPSSNDICNVCKYIEMLRNDKFK